MLHHRFIFFFLVFFNSNLINGMGRFNFYGGEQNNNGRRTQYNRNEWGHGVLNDLAQLNREVKENLYRQQIQQQSYEKPTTRSSTNQNNGSSRSNNTQSKSESIQSTKTEQKVESPKEQRTTEIKVEEQQKPQEQKEDIKNSVEQSEQNPILDFSGNQQPQINNDRKEDPKPIPEPSTPKPEPKPQWESTTEYTSEYQYETSSNNNENPFYEADIQTDREIEYYQQKTEKEWIKSNKEKDIESYIQARLTIVNTGLSTEIRKAKLPYGYIPPLNSKQLKYFYKKDSVTYIDCMGNQWISEPDYALYKAFRKIKKLITKDNQIHKPKWKVKLSESGKKCFGCLTTNGKIIESEIVDKVLSEEKAVDDFIEVKTDPAYSTKYEEPEGFREASRYVDYEFDESDYYKDLVNDYHKELNQFGIDSIEERQIKKERYLALKQSVESRSYSFNKYYKVPSHIHDQLKRMGYSPKSYERFYGTYAQHQLHTENLNQLNHIVDFYNEYQNVEEIREFAEATIEVINLSHEMNKKGNLEAGYAFSDFCNDVCAIGRGIKKGFGTDYEAIKSFIRNPKNKIKNVCSNYNDLREKVYSAPINLAKGIWYAINNPRGAVKGIKDIAHKAYNSFDEYYKNLPREEKLEKLGEFLYHLPFLSPTDIYSINKPINTDDNVTWTELSKTLGETAFNAAVDFYQIENLPKIFLAKGIVVGSKAVNKLGKIGKEAARIIGWEAEHHTELTKFANALRKYTEKEVIDPIKRLKFDIKIQNNDYENFKTEMYGGLEGAKKIFELLTGRKPCMDLDNVVLNGRRIVFRIKGKSGHAKIQIEDSVFKKIQKITFI